MKVQNLGKIASALCVPTDYLIYGTSPYKENARLNSIISGMPKDIQKQAEKLLLLFLETFRVHNQTQTDEKNSDENS